MRHVVVAPDSFKGSATAIQAAAALAEGWRSVRPGEDVRLVPLADGGEGTLDAFATAYGADARTSAQRMPLIVTGPDGRRAASEWLLLRDADGVTTGVVEAASTCGISMMGEPDPLGATSTGFGEAIAAALDYGVEKIVLAIGGTACTDGGAGALVALGAGVEDASGSPIEAGGGALRGVERVDLGGLRPLPPGGAVVLGDVTNPLLGPGGAAAVFGPQKGADARDVTALEAGLARWAERVASSLADADADTAADVAADVPGADVAVAADADAPGAGAAGGLGFGLMLWGATMSPGSTAIGDLLGLPALLRGASIVLTGEGRFDEQSAHGKVPAYVLRVAGEVPVVLVAGSVEAAPTGFAQAIALDALAGSVAEAMEHPLIWLRAAGAEVARTFA